MARGESPNLKLEISGIPEEWISPNEEIKLNMRHEVSVNNNGSKRTIVFDDSKFVRDFLKNFLGIG